MDVHDGSGNESLYGIAHEHYSTAAQTEFDAYEKILDQCASGRSLDEVKIYEDLYDVDAQEAFSRLCEANLGIRGLRLDLFLEALASQQTNGKSKSNGIHEVEEKEDLD